MKYNILFSEIQPVAHPEMHFANFFGVFSDAITVSFWVPAKLGFTIEHRAATCRQPYLHTFSSFPQMGIG